MNVWTHTVGALLFFLLIVYLCVSPVYVSSICKCYRSFRAAIE
jgi:hypothetical protein